MAAGGLPNAFNLALYPDGRIVLQTFASTGPLPRSVRLVRILPEGSLDASFQPSESVNAFASSYPGAIIIPLPDGKLIVGASDNDPHLLDGFERRGLVRLNADGSLDATFLVVDEVWNQGHVGPPIALMPDGNLVLSFSTINGQGERLSQFRRILPDGALDTGFSSQPETRYPTQLVPQTDGRLLVVENLCAELSGPCVAGFLKRLNPNGSLDTTFNARVLERSPIRPQITVNDPQPGRSYTLEVSSDLRNWSPLNTQSAPEVGEPSMSFWDDESAWMDAGFYRLVSP